MKSFSFLTVVSALSASVAFAEPTVTLSRVQQRYPWNGLVDIDYTVAGMPDGFTDYTLTFTASYGDETVTMKTFDTYACCDLPMTDGSYHLVWDAKADGQSFNAANVTVKATLAYEPIAEDKADFMIIDLSAGAAEDATYPVRYVASNVVDAAQFAARNLYKTERIVLRHMPAQSRWLGKGGGGTVDKAALLDWLKTAAGEPYGNIWKYRHFVTLTKSYWMGIFAVTYGQYKQVFGKYPLYTLGWNGGGAIADTEIRPLAGLVWNDFCKDDGFLGVLNARCVRSGQLFAGFDLPTEAQWEAAARAGTVTKAYWGDGTKLEDYDPYEWLKGNSDLHQHPVGLKLPNPWGLYDVLGNVKEWCRDWYSSTELVNELDPNEDESMPKENRTPIPIVDPEGPDEGTTRTQKGGNFQEDCGGFGARSGFAPNNLWYSGNMCYQLGFRLSRTDAGTESAVSPAPVVVSEATLVVAGFDFGEGLLAPATLDNVYPLAWNSAADWAMGGDVEKAVTVTVTPLSGDPAEDPSTWTASGAAVVLVDASTAGAGLATWTPARRSLYRADLAVDGEAAGVRYFNLINTEGFAEGTSIKGGTLQLTLGEIPYTGLPIVPDTVVTVGEKVLVKNVDYTVVCADNVELGTATVTVTGLGDYKDTLTTTFVIVDPVRSVLAESEVFDGPIVDIQPGCTNCWVFRNPTLALPIAWNDGETFPGVGASVWPIGGTDVEGVLARVSIAPLAEAGGEAGAYTVLGEMSGEGVIEHTFSKGFWRLKLEVSDDQGDFSKSSALTGDVWIKRDATGLMIFVR